MLETYLSSVIIWMIIIFCICCIFGNGIKKNGWLDNESKKSGNRLFVLFTLSAVPILRLCVAGALVYMATTTREEFDKKYNKE